MVSFGSFIIVAFVVYMHMIYINSFVSSFIYSIINGCSHLFLYYYRHKKLRLAYIVISTFMVITALLSFISLTVLTAGFLAFYVLIFSCLMCCHTASFTWFGIAKFIVQNFGFLYNPVGRLAFSMFLSVLVWDLGLFGKISFAALMSTCLVEVSTSASHKCTYAFDLSIFLYHHWITFISLLC